MLMSPLPTINLPAFEGPLDLLLHLVREHRVDIVDIPIVPVTDQYIAYLDAMEERDLAIAGEFFVMAATLLEIKTRMLLPKDPGAESDEDGETDDPREALVRRLKEYEQFKALIDTFQYLESERGKLFAREPVDWSELYPIPIRFGEAEPDALIQALQALLADVDDSDLHAVTSVRRQKISLKIAIRILERLVKDAGRAGLEFLDAFPATRIRIDIIMTFLAMLELIRQERLRAVQRVSLGPIRLYARTLTQEASSIESESTPS